MTISSISPGVSQNLMTDLINTQNPLSPSQILQQNTLANTAAIIEGLLPSTNSVLPGIPDINSLIPGLPPVEESAGAQLLNTIFKVQESFAQYKMSSIKGEARETNEYQKYLEFPNPDLKELAMSIVSPEDSNDEKMYKIEQWVIENFPYQLDVKTYGELEHWALPSEMIKNGTGDCEDGAFLIHSLGLNAGVPWENLRTYGGLVVWENEGGGLSSGGHGWTAYKSEEDDKWRVLDFSFFTTDKPLNEREGMANDFKYFEDYFFVNLQNTIDTPYSNAIKNPDDHSNYRVGNVTKGMAVNTFA